MLENEPTNGTDQDAVTASDGAASAANDAGAAQPARRTRKRTAAAASDSDDSGGESETPAKATRATRAPRATKAAKAAQAAQPASDDAAGAEAPVADEERPTTRRRTKAAAAPISAETPAAPAPEAEADSSGDSTRRTRSRAAKKAAATFSAVETTVVEPEAAAEPEAPSRSRRAAPVAAIFVAPSAVDPVPVRAAKPAPVVEVTDDDETMPEPEPRSRRRNRRGSAPAPEMAAVVEETVAEADEDAEDDEDDGSDESAAARRRRRRGRRGRGRGKGPHDDDVDEEHEADADAEAHDDDEDDEAGDGVTRRRRRRRRRGSGGDDSDSRSEDGVVTVVKIREPRPARDEVQGVSGSTRLEAKRQRRRDGRDQRRTRPSILSESEFLARREAVDRVMAIRQQGDRTQIAVLEDGVLVEHYVTRASSGTMVGNVYLGKVQNVLPSMEAAFVDIGRGRNAVLYAGEVNWDMAGLEGRARSIEQALKSGDSVLVQVTKDPIGHKGARLTSHIALSGRHLVYVPNGNASGISRKLSDVERKRLRDILKKLVPEGAGVIVRTAAEGASEDELERDVTRLSAQWEAIEAKVSAGGAPVQLYEEPDLVIRVVRDLFNEDFRELIVQGNGAYDMVENYLNHVSPDLVERLKRHTGTSDIFAVHRIDEQIMKGLDRKVFLPSGGSLVIDRTEAMTVVDVNTGKYTGTGGNLEETVTRNNLEAAEEIVRQLRLRDIGGIIVIDFIDMVLESNRELVLRRLTECLGRDRTKHQVTEITSLGLVQMTRKRIGQGLLEAFSETCEHCKGRGVTLHMEPAVERKGGPEVVHAASQAVESAAETSAPAEPTGRRRGRRGRGGAAAAAEAAVEVETDDVAEDVPDEAVDLSSEPETPAAAPVNGSGAVSTDGPVTTAWTPPATTSWVNLGAAQPAEGSGEGVQEPLLDLASLSSGSGGEIDGLESEAEAGNGRRRRVSRWRLRP
ncbi:MAG TPA: Rne/Rng family ribonuclease [Micromonosporaceae bacterium]